MRRNQSIGVMLTFIDCLIISIQRNGCHVSTESDNQHATRKFDKNSHTPGWLG